MLLAWYFSLFASVTLNILQWNAQGINGHGDELRLHINNRQEIIHLICVQETWLLENEHFDINNYEGVYRNRKTGIRGGWDVLRIDHRTTKRSALDLCFSSPNNSNKISWSVHINSRKTRASQLNSARFPPGPSARLLAVSAAP